MAKSIVLIGKIGPAFAPANENFGIRLEAVAKGKIFGVKTVFQFWLARTWALDGSFKELAFTAGMPIGQIMGRSR